MPHRNCCNVFVANLPFDWDEKRMRALFEQCGKIVSTKLMVDFESGASRGFGFVLFDCKESALKAIENHNGKRPSAESVADLIVSLSRRGESPEAEPSAKLYIRNLPQEVREEQLRELFTRYGQVTEVRVLRNRKAETTKRCVAFVDFSTIDEASAALQALNENVELFGEQNPLLIRFGDPLYAAKKQAEVQRLHQHQQQVQQVHQVHQQAPPQFAVMAPQQQQIQIMGPPLYVNNPHQQQQQQQQQALPQFFVPHPTSFQQQQQPQQAMFAPQPPQQQPQFMPQLAYYHQQQQPLQAQQQHPLQPQHQLQPQQQAQQQTGTIVVGQNPAMFLGGSINATATAAPGTAPSNQQAGPSHPSATPSSGRPHPNTNQHQHIGVPFAQPGQPPLLYNLSGSTLVDPSSASAGFAKKLQQQQGGAPGTASSAPSQQQETTSVSATLDTSANPFFVPAGWHA